MTNRGLVTFSLQYILICRNSDRVDYMCMRSDWRPLPLAINAHHDLAQVVDSR